MIKERLQDMQSIVGDQQKFFYDYLIDLGKDYSEVLPKEKHPVTFFPPKKKECYANSLLNFIDNGVAYVEGYYITESLGLELNHAWNIDRNGAVIDTTEAISSYTVKERFGIEIPNEIVQEYIELEEDDLRSFMTCLHYYIKKLKNG